MPSRRETPLAAVGSAALCRSWVNLYLRKFPDGTVVWTAPHNNVVSVQRFVSDCRGLGVDP